MREYFKDLPDTSTPIEAERINGLLNGQESIEKLVVGNIESKNKFNKNTTTNGWIRADGAIMDSFADTYFYSDYIEIEPNEEYTINFSNSTGLGSAGIVQYDENKNFISSLGNETQNKMTVTTGTTAKYIRFTGRQDSKDDIQFEEGNVATSYSEYIDFGNYHVQTGIETKCNYTIDGKQAYRFRNNLGALPNNADGSYQTGLLTSYKIIKYKLMAKRLSDDQIFDIPFISLNGQQYIYGYPNNASQVLLKTNFDASAYSLIVDIEYTK